MTEPLSSAPEHAPRRERLAEAALVARVAAGDEGAFAQLYETHRRRLHRLAYGVLLDAQDAREAVQEAFLQLHRAAAAWEPHARVGTWLYRVVLNHCLGLRQRLVRRFGRLGARPLHEVQTASHADSPERMAMLRQAAAHVTPALAKLPLKQRAVAVLFLEGELTAAEIAKLVGMTPNATRVTLHRALGALRASLAAQGIEALPTPDEPQTHHSIPENDDAHAS